MKKFEQYLKSLTKSQKIMLYFTVFLVCASLFYNYTPDLIRRDSLLQDSIEKLQRNIKNNSNLRLKLALKRDKERYLKTKSEYMKQKEQISLLMSQLYHLEFVFFDDKEWIKTLERILNKSIEDNLEIKYVKNNDIVNDKKDPSLVKKKKHIEIAGKGRYADIVQYLHYVESLPVLLKFQDIKMVGDEKGSVDFNIIFDTFGIGL